MPQPSFQLIKTADWLMSGAAPRTLHSTRLARKPQMLPPSLVPLPALMPVVLVIESAQTHWRAVNAPHMVALVRAAKFENGKLVERPDESGGDQPAA
ncbi:hypothetical protein ASG92_21345 [Arthrobacter sp. Soil736]|nr:hypothetical protein ASG92_21345 [Arthrobacter sp. Soil736]